MDDYHKVKYMVHDLDNKDDVHVCSSKEYEKTYIECWISWLTTEKQILGDVKI